MRRYVLVGLGSRSSLYSRALLTDYRTAGELVGYCDLSQHRMDYWNAHYRETLGADPAPTAKPVALEKMLAEQRADGVIVTSVDRTHDDYIVRALNAGCDVITEKPMTIDAPRCQRVLDAVRETGRRLTVTFNARYAPRTSLVKDLLSQGVIGDVLSVHFEWLLDTSHGADYFRRWHRDKRNSGGLMVHKATHHFDLVNWWLASHPESVYGVGRLAFYGRENAEKRGVQQFYERSLGSEVAKADPFALHLEKSAELEALYRDGEAEDGYVRDRSVFADGISIEDDMALLVTYASGATMTYHLTAYSPWEGWRIAFNGTRGRLEAESRDNAYVRPRVGGEAAAPVVADAHEAAPEQDFVVRVRPHWGKPVEVPVPPSEEGHGGGDARLLKDLFTPGAEPDPLGRAAGHEDGAWSILIGIAANRSFATGLPVRIADLVRF